MNTGNFVAINWTVVALGLGATLLRVDGKRREVHMYRPSTNDGSRPGMQLIISDNGGEVNVSKIVPAFDHSVARTRDGANVGPLTLASHLAQALDGEPVDYAFNCDDDEAT